MAELITLYTGKNTDTWPSPSIWADCPVNSAQEVGDTIHIFENFGHGASGLLLGGDTPPVFPTVGSATGTTSAVGGILKVATAAVLNGGSMVSTQTQFTKVSTVAADSRKVWFECRLRYNASLADVGVFVGLSGTIIETEIIADGGALAAVANNSNLIGFFAQTHASAPTFATVTKNGVAATLTVEAIAATPVVDTFIKLGLKYDPSEDPAEKISFYVNGTRRTAFVTEAQMQGASFSQTAIYGGLLLAKTNAVAIKTVDVDWVRCASDRV